MKKMIIFKISLRLHNLPNLNIYIFVLRKMTRAKSRMCGQTDMDPADSADPQHEQVSSFL